MHMQLPLEEDKFVPHPSPMIRPLSVQQFAEADMSAVTSKARNMLSPPSKAKSSQRSLSPSVSDCSPSPGSVRRKTTKDNFSLIKLIGTGAFAKVALVEEIGTGRLFAMKVMEKSFLRQVSAG